MKKVIGCISLVLLGLVAMLLAGLVVTEIRPCGRLDGFLADSGCIRMLEPDTEQTYHIAFSPDGTTLAALAFNNTVQLWRVSDGTLVRTLGDYRDVTIWDMAFTPNGEFMAIGLWEAVQFWRVSDGTLVHTLKVSETDNLTFSPDGKILATGSYAIELWQISDGALLHTIKRDSNRVENLAFSQDGSLLATSGYDEIVRLWRVSDGELVQTLKGHPPRVENVVFAPDGITLASSSGKERIIQIWRISDGVLLHTLQGYKGKILSPHIPLAIAFSPDGTTLASGGVDGVVQLWRTSDGSPLYTIKHGSPLFDPWGGWIWDVAFSPDGTILATNQRFSGVRFFDIYHFDNIALERRPNNHFKLTILARRL